MKVVGREGFEGLPVFAIRGLQPLGMELVKKQVLRGFGHRILQSLNVRTKQVRIYTNLYTSHTHRNFWQLFKR